MKKTVLVCVFCLAALCGFAQEVETLDQAMNTAAAYITSCLPLKSRVMALPFTAPARELSDYVTDELSTRLVNTGSFTVVERTPEIIKDLDKEVFYQNAGEVSDESMQQIGKKTGAEIVVTGSLSRAGDACRLTVKIIHVEKTVVLGQRSGFVKMDAFLAGLLKNGNALAEVSGRPAWVSMPREYGMRKYEKSDVTGVSPWYYASAMSTKAAAEQRARTRARENVQAFAAANIASDFKARIDITEYSMFTDLDVENVQRLIETAVTNSIKTRVPGFEVLEWYVEQGADNAQPWYLAHLFVRFPRNKIIEAVEKIEPEKIVATVLRQAEIPEAKIPPEEKKDLTEKVLNLREEAVRLVKEGWE
jgi:TolB-like protein